MAIRNSTNIAPVVSGQIPPNFKGTLILRVKEAKFGPSKSSGQPQIVWTTEVASPTEILSEYDGKTYSLDSKDISIYLSLSEVKKDGSPSDNLDYIVNTLHPMLGLPAEIDDEKPNCEQYVGLCFQVIAESVERVEQKKDSKTGQYVPVLDAENNKISRGWEWKMIGIRDILKKATTVAGKPF